MKRPIGETAAAVAIFLFAVCSCSVPEKTSSGLPASTTLSQDSVPPDASAAASSAGASSIDKQAASATESAASKNEKPYYETVSSPFAKKRIKKILLKENKEMFKDSEDNTVTIKTMEQPKELEKIPAVLCSGEWQYFPEESGWIKYWPVYAKKIVILEFDDGERAAVHLYDDGSDFLSVGTIEAGVEYEAFIKQAILAYRNGNTLFHRYRVPSETRASLIALFS